MAARPQRGAQCAAASAVPSDISLESAWVLVCHPTTRHHARHPVGHSRGSRGQGVACSSHTCYGVSDGFLVRPWVIISAREARALRDHACGGPASADDLQRALSVLGNQLGWLADHNDQSNTERLELIRRATDRDSTTAA